MRLTPSNKIEDKLISQIIKETIKPIKTTEIDNKLEPRSRCKNSCIINEFYSFTLIYKFFSLIKYKYL